MFTLKDLNNQKLPSALFYSAELQKVEKDEKSLWFIQDILKKKENETGNLSILSLGKVFLSHSIPGFQVTK